MADEERRVLRSFNKDGIDRGEREVHLVVEAAVGAAHLKFLEDTGIDVKQVMVNGPLKVLPWTTHAKRQRHLWRSERRCS